MAKTVGPTTTTAGPSARFRQRKISVKQTLQILLQSDIPDLEDEQQRELQQVETGVEKGEEEEHHLKAAIDASNAASSGAKVEQVYIPTPDASKRWLEYDKYYDKKFTPPASYIRLSATVEDTSGCPYCMDEEDEKFLKELNSKFKPTDEKCTEDEFEMVCYKFESVVSEKQPYLTMDPTQVLSYEELKPVIIQEITQAENDPASPEFLLSSTTSSIYRSTLKKNNISKKDPIVSFKQFGEHIYPHWKSRKIARDGRPIYPVLKFEENAGSDKDDDPYVCFRRREVRQVRKTRRTDQQSSTRLRKLQSEMETAKNLMEMVVRREQMRKEALQMEWDIFEQRCKVKGVKRKLGIKGEDEDLVAHKKKKTSQEEISAKKAAEAGTTAAANVSSQNGNVVASSTATAATGNDKKNNNNNTNVSAANGSGVNNIHGTGNNAVANASAIHSVPANVRLPASKIPDLELLSLEQVLSEKETTIKNAVKTKLKTRTQNDRDWVNYTDNPFVPYCDYFDPEPEQRKNLQVIDPKHAAYSSLASPYPPSSDVTLKLPLSSSLGSSYASRVENSPNVLRAEVDEETGELNVLSTIKEKDMVGSSHPFNVPRRSAMSLRRRVGRGGRVMIDRRGLVRQSHIENQLPEEEQETDNDGGFKPSYDRIKKQYEFDSDVELDNMEFSANDPSRLNGISDETQSVRFGSMLLSKAYESYREAYQQRQQQLLTLQQKVLQQQKEQQQQQQQQQNSDNKPSNSPTNPNEDTAGGSNNGGGSSSNSGGGRNGNNSSNNNNSKTSSNSGNNGNGSSASRVSSSSTKSTNNNNVQAPAGTNSASATSMNGGGINSNNKLPAAVTTGMSNDASTPRSSSTGVVKNSNSTASNNNNSTTSTTPMQQTSSSSQQQKSPTSQPQQANNQRYMNTPPTKVEG